MLTSALDFVKDHRRGAILMLFALPHGTILFLLWLLSRHNPEGVNSSLMKEAMMDVFKPLVPPLTVAAAWYFPRQGKMVVWNLTQTRFRVVAGTLIATSAILLLTFWTDIYDFDYESIENLGCLEKFKYRFPDFLNFASVFTSIQAATVIAVFLRSPSSKEA